MIRFRLENFKSLKKIDLQLGKLTLLTGLNGAGKSSVIQALLSIRQSFQSGRMTNGELIVSGDLVDLGSPADVLFEGAEQDIIGFGFVVDDKTPEVEFRYSVTSGHRSGSTISESKDANGIQLMLAHPCSRALLGGELSDRYKIEKPPALFHYLNAERNGPRKFLPVSLAESDSQSIGSRGEFVLDFLELYQDVIALEPDDPRRISNESDRLRAHLEVWLNEVSPGARLDINRVPNADLVVGSYSFGEIGQLRSREFRATNVGFGLSYILPVLAALLATPPGGLVIIENPEAHLHPKGQTKVGELCARAAAAGVQVVIETHSDHLMDGIRIAVRDEIALSSDVVFHYFTRIGAESFVESPELDPNGRLSSWPVDFFDQHRRNTARLVRPKSQ